MSFPPIENYGIIGNLCTAALVSIDSSVDFFCYPEFHSPTIFAALLDPEKGGSFSVRPAMPDMQCKQMYVAETNILVTRFLSEAAAVEVTDFMPVTSSIRKSQIVRHVHVIHGAADFTLCCHPAFNYGRSEHTLKVENTRATFQPCDKESASLLLRSSVPLTAAEGAAMGRFSLKEKQTAVFVLGSPDASANTDVGCTEPDLGDIDISSVQQDLTETLDYWRSWIGKSTYTGRWRETVNRSALALKVLSSRHHGSLVAAVTFGLPEQVGGQRNWDYRFVWIRDAAFTLYAFMRLGLRSEADDFFQWMRQQINRSKTDDKPMQIMYGLDGRTHLKEETLEHMPGYRHSRPVRIGNVAFEQMQLDIYGEVLDAVYLYSKYGHALPYDGWANIKKTLDWLGRNWNQPDEGIWEVRGGNKHFLHSRLMCWVAFDRAIRLARKRSLSAPIREWYENRDAIVEDIYSNFWNPTIEAFTQHKDTEAMDAAVLLMPLVRFISPIDPRWISTLKRIEHELAEGPLVYRYRHGSGAEDGLDGEEGSFTACSFWLVECLARAGQVEKARQHYEKLLAHGNHLGLFSEEIGRDGHQLGNFPQALSHLALISATVYLDRALSGKPQEAWA